MRVPITTIIATVTSATSAYAASGAQADEPGILAWAFLGFCAVIFVGQMVPAAMLLVGMIKGLVSSPSAAKSRT